MRKAVDEILSSVLNDFETSRQAGEEIKARALFRLLNYCPPSVAGWQRLTGSKEEK